MDLMQRQISLLRLAEASLLPSDFSDYFRLKELLAKTSERDRSDFRTIFSRFYGLNAGGMSREFKKYYFDRLFFMTISPDAEPPYAELLKELYKFPRLKGDQVLAVSFVSKLVAMHDESRSQYDVHVRNFFGIGKPAIGSIVFQIAGFIQNLGIIRNQYQAWSIAPDFCTVQRKAVARFPQLASCHVNRLCDFLVWTVGRRKLGRDNSVAEA